MLNPSGHRFTVNRACSAHMPTSICYCPYTLTLSIRQGRILYCGSRPFRFSIILVPNVGYLYKSLHISCTRCICCNALCFELSFREHTRYSNVFFPSGKTSRMCSSLDAILLGIPSHFVPKPFPPLDGSAYRVNWFSHPI